MGKLCPFPLFRESMSQFDWKVPFRFVHVCQFFTQNCFPYPDGIMRLHFIYRKLFRFLFLLPRIQMAGWERRRNHIEIFFLIFYWCKIETVVGNRALSRSHTVRVSHNTHTQSKCMCIPFIYNSIHLEMQCNWDFRTRTGMPHLYRSQVVCGCKDCINIHNICFGMQPSTETTFYIGNVGFGMNLFVRHVYVCVCIILFSTWSRCDSRFLVQIAMTDSIKQPNGFYWLQSIQISTICWKSWRSWDAQTRTKQSITPN